MKKCRKCNLEKDESKFDKNRYVCRSCRWCRAKERRVEKGWARKPGGRKPWKTAEEKKETKIKYYKENKDKINAQKKIYRDKNKEKVRAREQIYRQKNKDKLKEYEKEYRQKHKEKRRKQALEYEKRKAANEPSYKIKKYLSNSIYRCLLKNNSTKNNQSILKYLSYTMEELKQHLESLFEPWMTWNNHGKYDSNTWDDQDLSTWTWQIDHIIPHSTFKYTSMEDEEFKQCWALSNLRPLNAKQNILENTIERRIAKIYKGNI